MHLLRRTHSVTATAKQWRPSQSPDHPGIEIKKKKTGNAKGESLPTVLIAAAKIVNVPALIHLRSRDHASPECASCVDGTRTLRSVSPTCPT